MGHDAQEIEVATLHQFYRRLSELVGTEAMLKIYEQYKGTQLNVPVHLYDRELAAKRVLAEFDGQNQWELSRRYGYSQKWVYKVLRELK
ncbi:Mor transcription activator family protein [Lactiplantibacillus modestisalitolerans]|nr:Mor transcription activator family protein [Lactiplantibacillus modestisalitolerans]